ANMVASSVLGREAVQAGVRHFVFVSTIAVMGLPNNDQPLTPEMKPAPVSAYGQSKWAAEQALVNLMRNSGTRLTVIRPPLVYGPNPKGNLKQLIRLINSGLPMPWASVRNQRSMIGLSNLVHLLNHVCNLGNVEMPEPQTLMPADVCWSTPDLIRIIAKAMKRPARLFSMPQPVLNLSVRLPVIGSRCDTLLSSLVQQDQHLKEQLGWTPPETPASEIARMVGSVTVS
ncbi:MAG: NAD-dependent epimerase/dehydratase family protein, partial [Burkholderiaceae bacterium]